MVTPGTLRVHPCKPLQEPQTWRDVYQGSPPNDDYLAARDKYAPKEQP